MSSFIKLCLQFLCSCFMHAFSYNIFTNLNLLDLFHYDVILVVLSVEGHL